MDGVLVVTDRMVTMIIMIQKSEKKEKNCDRHRPQRNHHRPSDEGLMTKECAHVESSVISQPSQIVLEKRRRPYGAVLIPELS